MTRDVVTLVRKEAEECVRYQQLGLSEFLEAYNRM